MNCLHRFVREDLLRKHRPDCLRHSPARIVFPSPFIKKSKLEEEEEAQVETLEEHLGVDADVRGKIDGDKKPENILFFKQIKNTHRVPFVLYVDFETFIKKGVEEGVDDKDIHEPSGFCCLRVSAFDFLNNEIAYVYSGQDVMSRFYDHIMKEHRIIN